jgi:hypothetical protein
MGGNGVDGVVAVAGAMTLAFGFLDPYYSPCAGDFGQAASKALPLGWVGGYTTKSEGDCVILHQ